MAFTFRMHKPKSYIKQVQIVGIEIEQFNDKNL